MAMSEMACPTSGADMKPPIQPIAVPTSSAASPTGIPNGSFTFVKKPMRMMAITGRPIQATSHICAAGRMEMNVIEIPASVPSIAARGVSLRMYGPTNAPIITITPIMKAHASPADHAWMGSLVLRYTGSITTKTTMNMCGTLGPYGSAVTSSRFSRRARARARNV
jgi:hypothetical protein